MSIIFIIVLLSLLILINCVLRVVGGMPVVFPGNFGKVFRFCAWKKFKHCHKHLHLQNHELNARHNHHFHILDLVSRFCI